jgi:hypothetical protein
MPLAAAAVRQPVLLLPVCRLSLDSNPSGSRQGHLLLVADRAVSMSSTAGKGASACSPKNWETTPMAIGVVRDDILPSLRELGLALPEAELAALLES